jgi:hypothetical protein
VARRAAAFVSITMSSLLSARVGAAISPALVSRHSEAAIPLAQVRRHFEVGSVHAAARASARHPLHTSLTRVGITADGVISVRVRTFSDDFSAAVSRATGSRVEADHVVADRAAERYVGASLRLTIGGTPVALRLISQRRDGDVTWLELRATRKGTLRGALIESRLLMDFHADQVNIVQATYEGRSHTMSFSPGEKARRLP